VFSGLSPDGHLAELAELVHHPWMVGCQFHPEFRSRPNRPHPLFLGFVAAAKQFALSRGMMGDKSPSAPQAGDSGRTDLPAKIEEEEV